MYTKVSKALYATVVATMLLGASGVNADATNNSSSETIAVAQHETRAQAETAHREAIKDALLRISAATRLDLDVDLPARVSAPVSGD